MRAGNQNYSNDSTGGGGGNSGGSSWFNQFGIDTNNLNLGSIASRVSQFVPEVMSQANVEEVRTKKDDDYKRAKSLAESTHYEVEDLNEIPLESNSTVELQYQNYELRMELQRVREEFAQELASRDNHIKTLEARILNVNESEVSALRRELEDAEERANGLRAKLEKAVSHLKPMIAENRALNEKLQEKETIEANLRQEIDEMRMQQPLQNNSDRIENDIELLYDELSTIVPGLPDRSQTQPVQGIVNLFRESQEQINALQHTNENLEQSLTQVSNDLATKESELSRLENHVAKVESQLDELVYQNSSTENLEVEFRTRLSVAETERDSKLQALKEEHKQEISDLEGKIRTLSDKLKAINDNVNASFVPEKDVVAFVSWLSHNLRSLAEGASRINLPEFRFSLAGLNSLSSIDGIVDLVDRMQKENIELRGLVESKSFQESDISKDQEAKISKLEQLLEETELQQQLFRESVMKAISSVTQLEEPCQVDNVLLEDIVMLIQSTRGAFEDTIERLNTSGQEHTKAINALKESYEELLHSLSEEITEKENSTANLRSELDNVLKERAALVDENDIMREKLATVKSTLAPKLQLEMETSEQLRQEVAQLTEKNFQLREECDKLTAELRLAAETSNISSSADSEIERLKALLEQSEATVSSLTVEMDKANRRLVALQTHLAESAEASAQDALAAEAAAAEFRTRAETLERERESWESMAVQAREIAQSAEEKADMAIEDARIAKEELDSLIRARQRDALSLANLQAALDELQTVKQSEIDLAVDKTRKQLETALANCAELQSRLDFAEARLADVDQNAPALEALRAELQEKSLEVGHLRSRVVSLETYLAEAIRRAASAENQVDRRLVTNLLVQFLAAPRGDSKRFEMLQVIASVLRLSDEEKVKVGLLRKATGAESSVTRSGGAGESFTDLWISFLIKEASGRKGSEASQTQ